MSVNTMHPFAEVSHPSLQSVDPEPEPPRVVLSGSMSVLHVMAQLAEELREHGLDPVVPEADDDPDLWTSEAAARHKRRVSKLHMDSIRDRDTKALLVANLDRHDVDNYIGPNTFAEIAVAFADDRRVYLLQGMPAQYEDELRAWGVECLHGNVGILVDDLTSGNFGVVDSKPSARLA